VALGELTCNELETVGNTGGVAERSTDEGALLADPDGRRHWMKGEARDHFFFANNGSH
jgi:hypothetical protein